MLSKLKILILGQRVRGEKVKDKVHFITTEPTTPINFFDWCRQYKVSIHSHRNVTHY